jgi:hypothetical protein
MQSTQTKLVVMPDTPIIVNVQGQMVYVGSKPHFVSQVGQHRSG